MSIKVDQKLFASYQKFCFCKVFYYGSSVFFDISKANVNLPFGQRSKTHASVSRLHDCHLLPDLFFKRRRDTSSDPSLVSRCKSNHACLSLPLCSCLTFFFQTKLLVVALLNIFCAQSRCTYKRKDNKNICLLKSSCLPEKIRDTYFWLVSYAREG